MAEFFKTLIRESRRRTNDKHVLDLNPRYESNPGVQKHVQDLLPSSEKESNVSRQEIYTHSTLEQDSPVKQNSRIRPSTHTVPREKHNDPVRLDNGIDTQSSSELSEKKPNRFLMEQLQAEQNDINSHKDNSKNNRIHHYSEFNVNVDKYNIVEGNDKLSHKPLIQTHSNTANAQLENTDLVSHISGTQDKKEEKPLKEEVLISSGHDIQYGETVFEMADKEGFDNTENKAIRENAYESQELGVNLVRDEVPQIVKGKDRDQIPDYDSFTPKVHIGHIDIIIQVPQQVSSQSPATESSLESLLKRRYLRGV